MRSPFKLRYKVVGLRSNESVQKSTYEVDVIVGGFELDPGCGTSNQLVPEYEVTTMEVDKVDFQCLAIGQVWLLACHPQLSANSGSLLPIHTGKAIQRY